jgi:hypothetical protein
MGNKIGDVFFKTVEEKHFMRVVGGYGLQYDAFACFDKEGIKDIEVLERHTGITWLSKPKDWFEHGKISDYGRGKQIFLSLKYMKRKNKEAIEKRHEEQEQERAKIIQERIF